jgi:hypothetical protein
MAPARRSEDFMAKKVACPVCGRRLARAELGKGSFHCPGCEARLRLAKVPGPARVAILFISTAIGYGLLHAAGIRGGALAVGCVLLVPPASWLITTVVLLFSPRIEVARNPSDGPAQYTLLPPGTGGSA